MREGPKRLRDWRREQDLSQSELAVLLGTDQSTISYWEAGERAPSRRLASLLRDKTGIPFDAWD
jgi:transcriptional regulator with XRE-family HTH domain